MSDRVDAIREKLYREEGATIWAVLDGASVPGLLQQLADHEPEHICLYAGELQPDVAEVAPYLVKLEAKAPFTEWLIEKGWGQHWGVFAETGEDLRSLRKHFRSFLTVYDETGKSMLFRYYDPRVLRVHLPTCNGEELKTMFGPVQSYMMEDENPAAILRFRLKSGSLVKQSEPVP
jgi:Domain of unknown function (DUF4123)